MKKMVSSFLAFVLVLCGTVSCYAVEDRASKYFDGYLLAISAQGDNQMTVSFTVYGMSKMDQIGAYSIRIEEEVSDGKWITSFTAYGDKDPNNFYSYNAYEHGGDYSFTGVPGVKYRAVMKAYASNSSGSEYSSEIACSGKVCK